MNQASAWLMVAAVMVGFAAAWLVLEVRRAWAPESLRSVEEHATAPVEAAELTQLMPALVGEVTNLRREITAVRAAELEVALRNRQRELLLTQALRTAAAGNPPSPLADTEHAEPPVGEAPVEDEPVDDTPADDTPIEEVPVGEAPVEHEPADDTPADDTPIEEVPVGEAPVEHEPVDDTPVDDVFDDTPDDEVDDTPPDLTPGDIAALSAVARG